MGSKKHNDWDVYQLIQPHFFNHYHFYTRRAVALEKAGLNSSLISFVSNKMYLENADRYKKAYMTKVIQIRNDHFIHTALPLFVIKELLKGRKLVFHVLRSNANSLLLLKPLPFINSRLKIVYEFEGDSLSELNYTHQYSRSISNLNQFQIAKNKLKPALINASNYLRFQTSNALIVMSEEHKSLWKARLGKDFKSFIFPSLPEEERIYFNSVSRAAVRKELNIDNKKVLIYVGNVVCSWQRLEDMCKFVSELSDKVNDLALLLLVPESNIEIAKKAVNNYNISHLTIIKSVPSNQIYEYMSAADAALYLRHNHQMNNIVTSGKLGEYLAAGLPVVSTGANASVLNRYMEKEKCLVKVSDSLEVTSEIVASLVDRLDSAVDRSAISKQFYHCFNMDKLINGSYPNFIKEVISD